MVIAFHKPYGVLCQFTPDLPGQRTLAEFGFPAGVYPVGRLDMDSEGLLLLTDEAGFNHKLLDPKTAHPRTYLAQVEGEPTPEALVRLEARWLGDPRDTGRFHVAPAFPIRLRRFFHVIRRCVSARRFRLRGWNCN